MLIREQITKGIKSYKKQEVMVRDDPEPLLPVSKYKTNIKNNKSVRIIKY